MSAKAARPGQLGGRRMAVALSVGAHGAILIAVLLAEPPPPTAASRSVEVRLVALPPLRPAAIPEPSPPGSPAETPAPAALAKRIAQTPRPADPPARTTDVQAPLDRPAPSGMSDAADASGVTASELAGAARVGGGGGTSGPGGGACDMLERLESRLRRDARVRDAVDRAVGEGGTAIRVWNGEWVRHPGEEGGGLAAVREAIIWEVGFAPDACRTQSVRGLVQIALGDAPDDPRLVLGSGAWRWSDLLAARGRARS